MVVSFSSPFICHDENFICGGADQRIVMSLVKLSRLIARGLGSQCGNDRISLRIQADPCFFNEPRISGGVAWIYKFKIDVESVIILGTEIFEYIRDERIRRLLVGKNRGGKLIGEGSRLRKRR